MGPITALNDGVSDNSPVLFYRSSCKKCRFLALLSSILSLGIVVTKPINTEWVQVIYDQFPASRGKLLLIHKTNLYFGFDAIRQLPIMVLKNLVQNLVKRLICQRV